ncbi:hypothetical protein GCM10027275_35190 [Rhabdobacter roseus]
MGILFLLQGIWPGLVIILGTSAFIIHTFLSTEYTVDASYLRVRSGIFFNKTIEIASIRKVEETNTLLSSPAMSLDRLEVFYNRFDSVIVSPKEKAAFIRQLQAVNDRIEVVLHDKSTRS